MKEKKDEFLPTFIQSVSSHFTNVTWRFIKGSSDKRRCSYLCQGTAHNFILANCQPYCGRRMRADVAISTYIRKKRENLSGFTDEENKM